MKLAVLVPPAGDPSIPSLAAELLARIARDQGHAITALHSPLELSERLKWQLENNECSSALFAPFYYETSPEEEVVRLLEVTRSFAARCELNGRFAVSPPAEGCEALQQELLELTEQIPPMLTRLVKRLGPDLATFDLVTFTIAFDGQKLPAACLAKRLRRSGYLGPICAGGSAVVGDMGAAFLEAFPEFDIIVDGDAEHAWPRFLEAFQQGTWRSLGGVSYRGESGVVQNAGRRDPVALYDGQVDWSSYLAHKAESVWRSEPTILLAESSRGCWWGEKHPCAFCSACALTQEYRAREADEVIEEIERIFVEYAPFQVMLTDLILPYRDLSGLLHKLFLRRAGRAWSIFAEVKSTYSRKTIAQLALAGIDRVQPGIENLSTGTLRILNKGARGLQHVNFLKWCTAYRVIPTYSILCGAPGDTPEWMRENTTLARLMRHFYPPNPHGVYMMRGSSYQRFPERYGIVDVEPILPATLLYRHGDVGSRMTHILSYRAPSLLTQDYLESVNELLAESGAWTATFMSGHSLTRIRNGTTSFVARRSSQRLLDFVYLDETQTGLLDLCEEPTSLRNCRESLGLSPADFESTVEQLEELGLVYREGASIISLPIPSDANALQDSGWAGEGHDADATVPVPDTRALARSR